jgi:hypothetical protein
MLIPKYAILSEILHIIIEVVFRIFQFQKSRFRRKDLISFKRNKNKKILMKVFVLQNVIVMGRHTNFVIVIKRMQRNIENEVINENEGRPLFRGETMNENLAKIGLGKITQSPITLSQKTFPLIIFCNPKEICVPLLGRQALQKYRAHGTQSA